MFVTPRVADSPAKHFPGTGWPILAFAVTSGLQVFGRLSDAFQLGGMIAELAGVWRDFTHILWLDFFGLFGGWVVLQPTSAELDALTLAVLIAATVVSSFAKRTIVAVTRDTRPRYLQLYNDANNALFAFCVALLYLVFVFPHISYSWQQADWTARIGHFLLWSIMFLMALFASLMMCIRARLTSSIKLSRGWAAQVWIFTVYVVGMLWFATMTGFGTSPLSALATLCFSVSILLSARYNPQIVVGIFIWVVILLASNWTLDAVEPAIRYVEKSLDAAMVAGTQSNP